jgi:hypothetical protein
MGAGWAQRGLLAGLVMFGKSFCEREEGVGRVPRQVFKDFRAHARPQPSFTTARVRPPLGCLESDANRRYPSLRWEVGHAGLCGRLRSRLGAKVLLALTPEASALVSICRRVVGIGSGQPMGFASGTRLIYELANLPGREISTIKICCMGFEEILWRQNRLSFSGMTDGTGH